MSLSRQERNLAGIFLSGSREGTIAQMREALPDMDEPDVCAAAESAIGKLSAMSGPEFSALAAGLAEGGLL